MSRRKVFWSLFSLVLASIFFLFGGFDFNHKYISTFTGFTSKSADKTLSLNKADTPVLWENSALSRPKSEIDDSAIQVMTLKESHFETPSGAKKNDDYADDYWSMERQLVPGAIPLNIHYFWCGIRWFQFKNYMSVMSVIRTTKPDKIVFHYESLPTIDRLYYNQWFDDLRRDYPFFVLSKMSPTLSNFCNTATRDTQLQLITSVLNDEGGLFVGESTWLLKFPPSRRDATVNFEFALSSDNLEGFVLQRAGFLSPNKTIEGILSHMTRTGSTSPSGGIRRSSCTPVRHLHHAGDKATCLIVKDGKFDSLYPMHIWEENSTFARISRRIFYGTEEVRLPKPTYDTLVPNIGHMIWIGGGKMDFLFYLSLLSFVYVAKMDKVYIHGDREPKGPYWEKIKLREKERVKFITRTPPLWIYQGHVEYYRRALMSDVIRVDLMIKYGGVYLDTDAIWVKPLSYEDRGYDAVATYDWIDWSYPFPDSVNFGVSYGKKGAPFWHIFRDSMRILHNESPGFTAVQMPYKLLERYPHLLRIDRRLGAICYKLLCHPIWVKDYHNEKNNHVTSKSIPNWKVDLYVFHWTYPNPREYANLTTLMRSTGLFADVGKNVLRMAGILPPLD